MSETDKSLSPSGAFNQIFMSKETNMNIEDLDSIALNVSQSTLSPQYDFSFVMKDNFNNEAEEENLEVSDIRRSSLSQLTREGDLDRVRRFLEFSGDQSLKKINKLDESKV